MKRFHVHVAVDDLAKNVRFYSAMFGAPPAVEKPDYAKWMLVDPRINFAISTRARGRGVDHLGLQVDSAEELQALRTQAERADLGVFVEDGASCCYARSDKHWIQDPQGIAWETFHSLDTIPVFGAPAVKSAPDGGATDEASACCSPAAKRAEPAATGCCA
jgi:catechol 2,3-dioxygenase-like lactoylglutathione lyase family enzyme